MSEIRETLRLFTGLVAEQDMLHEKDYIAKIPEAREDEDSIAFQRNCHGDSTNPHNFTSREVSLEEGEILNCGDKFKFKFNNSFLPMYKIKIYIHI